MADPPTDHSPQADTPQLLSQAQEILEEIKSFKAQAEAQLKQVEIARKNTDSEALLAFNAKKVCEEHATVISGVKGAVEADANTIATNKQRSDEALAAVNSAKASVDADIKTIDSRRKEIDQSAITVDQHAATITKAAESGASRVKDIEALKESAESNAKTATDSAKAAAQAATDADLANERAEQSSTNAAALVAAISEHRDSTTQTVSETKALLTEAQASEGSLKKVLEHLANSDQIATNYEKRVEVLTADLQGLIQRVEALLPGATSAGLAHHSTSNDHASRVHKNNGSGPLLAA